MKKTVEPCYCPRQWLKQSLRITKIGIIFFTIGMTTLYAESYSQVKKMNLQISNESLMNVLDLLEEKSDYTFLYSSADIQNVKGISLNAANQSIEEILNKCLAGTELSYEINEKLIILKKNQIRNDENTLKKITISGTVKDKGGNPLPGVSVVIKGSTFGITTDVSGFFKLDISTATDLTLVFSFVGMESQELVCKADKNTTAHITMLESTTMISEVVVTGYGNIRKESFTGNSVTIKKEDLLNVSKTNVLQALQVFDPSFRITENNEWGSDPNNLPETYIRGRSGIGVKELDKKDLTKSQLENNPNLPLFIMDGFEVSSEKLYDFDPTRIESVTILKDAAATAMYGSRAANGVVVITTTVPKTGQLAISYNMSGSLTMPDLSDYNLMDASGKLEAEKAAGLYINENPSTQYQLDQEYNNKLANVLKGVNTYWLSKPLQTVFNHKHSLYIEGGSDNLRFGVDFSYNNEDGIMKESYRDRIGAGLYVDYRFKNFQVRNYISYYSIKSEESPYGTFSDYTSKLPYDEYRDEYGNYTETTKHWHGFVAPVNPLYEAGLGSFNKSTQNQLIDNLSLNWYITRDLQLKGQVSVTKTMSESNNFLDPKSKKNTEPLSLTNQVSGELRNETGNALTWDVNAFAAYNKAVANHNINLNLGINVKTDESSTVSSEYRGFPSGELHSPNYASEIYTKPTTAQSRSHLFGFIGTLNYSYNNIYLMDLSVRTDGSSKFGADKKFAPFWSGGLGLNIHNYPFLKGLEWINVLRVKGSYGVTGKVNFPSYAAQTMYRIQVDQWYKSGFGASLIALGNEKLGWEKTGKLNFGIDLNMFKDIIQLTASYYRDKTVDLVNSVTIPTSSGFSTYMDNLGEVENKGVEITLRSNILNQKDLFISAFVNASHNKNKILKISESLKAYNDQVAEYYKKHQFEKESTTPLMQYQEGGSLTSIFAMKSLGIDPATGEEILVNKNGATTYTWNASEQVVVGNTEPTLQGAFGFNIRYKNLSLYTTFMYEFGGQRYNSTLVEKVENADIYNKNIDKRVFSERWKAPGNHAKYKAIQKTVSEGTHPTERFVQDYNVLSLNSLTLGYDFNPGTIRKIGLNMLRLELGANEIFRASTVKAERGLSYPYARSMNISVKISL